MILARLGSLNALEQTKPSRFWNDWLTGPVPSADTIGRVFSLTDCDTIRAGIHEIYVRLKRNKALQPPWQLVPWGNFSTLPLSIQCSISGLRACWSMLNAWAMSFRGAWPLCFCSHQRAGTP